MNIKEIQKMSNKELIYKLVRLSQVVAVQFFRCEPNDNELAEEIELMKEEAIKRMSIVRNEF